MVANLGLNDASSDTDDDDASPPQDAAKARARAAREERRLIVEALPRPIGKRGGAHASLVKWTSEESEALLRLRPLHADRQPAWAVIASKLAQETGQLRSSTSVRQHWLRMRNGRDRARLPRGQGGRAKNLCGRCGALKLGHVCTAPRSETGDEGAIDAMTAQVRRAIEEGALESEEEW